jgi:ribosomal protein S18 acetylase RimI-like enzyme
VQLELRLAERTDAAAIHQVMKTAGAAIPDDEWYFVDNLNFVEEHIQQMGFTVVAILGSDVVGFQIVRLPGAEDDNLGREIGLSGEELLKVAHIESAAVLPTHRGEGIQKRMVTWAEELLGRMGYAWYMCTVYPKNIYSLRNLDALGYRIVATRTKYGGFERHILLKSVVSLQGGAPITP